MLTNEFRTYRNSAAMLGGTQVTAWYIGLYKNAHTPAATDTMASLLATAGEITTYEGGTRPLLVPDAYADGIFSNAGADLKVVFPVAETVRGRFITSNPVIGSTTGILADVVASPSPKPMDIGEALDVTAGWVDNLGA